MKIIIKEAKSVGMYHLYIGDVYCFVTGDGMTLGQNEILKVREQCNKHLKDVFNAGDKVWFYDGDSQTVECDYIQSVSIDDYFLSQGGCIPHEWAFKSKNDCLDGQIEILKKMKEVGE